MRTTRDALLSLRWYLVDVLAPSPPLLEMAWEDVSWTPEGRQVANAYTVDAHQWAFLASMVSATQEVVGNGYPWTRRGLAEDPRPLAWGHQIVLPDASTGATLTTQTSFVPEPEWEIRDSADKGMLELPLALVLPTGNLTSTGSAYSVAYTQAAEVQCYLRPFATADEATREGRKIEERLQQGFRLHGVGVGRPLRVPLWDFDEVDDDLTGPILRYEHDFLRVNGFATTLVPQEDWGEIRVVASMLLEWRRGGAIPTGPLTQRVLTKFVAEPA